MPRFEKSGRYVFSHSTAGKDGIWTGTPSRACMRLDLNKQSGEPAPKQGERACAKDNRGDTEKIGDIVANPKDKLMHYEKALVEYEQAAVSLAKESDIVHARERVLRIKGKIGKAKEAVSDMLVKRAEKSSKKEAMRLLERALEVLGEAKDMHYKCGDLHSCKRVDVKMEGVEGKLHERGWYPPE